MGSSLNSGIIAAGSQGTIQDGRDQTQAAIYKAIALPTVTIALAPHEVSKHCQVWPQKRINFLKFGATEMAQI